MIFKRIIPIITLKRGYGVKTIRYNYNNPIYLGDPINLVKLFNDKGANELAIIDISASRENTLKIDLLSKIAKQAFMPLSYGGGIKNIEDAKKIVSLGYEKIILNSIVFEDISIIEKIANILGSSSTVVAMDIKKAWLGHYKIYDYLTGKFRPIDIEDFTRQIIDKGAGEIIFNLVDKDGTLEGTDFVFLKRYINNIKIPVIINGGIKDYEEIKKIFANFNVTGIGAGRLFSLYGRHKAVLVSYPTEEEQKYILGVKKFCDE